MFSLFLTVIKHFFLNDEDSWALLYSLSNMQFGIINHAVHDKLSTNIYEKQVILAHCLEIQQNQKAHNGKH